MVANWSCMNCRWYSDFKVLCLHPNDTVRCGRLRRLWEPNERTKEKLEEVEVKKIEAKSW